MITIPDPPLPPLIFHQFPQSSSHFPPPPPPPVFANPFTPDVSVYPSNPPSPPPPYKLLPPFP